MTKVAEKLKRLFHQGLEERDWEKIAGDIIQLAHASLGPVVKTYTKEQIAEALRATFKNIDNKLAEVLTRLDLPAFKVGDRVRVKATGRYVRIHGVDSDGRFVGPYEGDDILGGVLGGPFTAQELEADERSAPTPVFRVGDRVRIENYPGSLQGQLGHIHQVVDGSTCIVDCDDGSFCPVHITWLKPVPEFIKDSQRVRVKATGQVGRIKAVLVGKRFLVEGAIYKAIELEPAPFKVSDRVRWRLGSGLPWNYGAVEYLSNERAGVRLDGHLVEVVERLLEADLLDPVDYPAASPMFRVGDRVRRKSDGVEGEITQVKTGGLVNVVLDDGARLGNWTPDKFELIGPTPTFRVGDRVRGRGTKQTGVVATVRTFGKLDVALDKGGGLSDYSPDNFELLKPAGTRRFVEDLVSRMAGVAFTHEEAERLRQQIAFRTRV